MIFKYERRRSSVTKIGGLNIGGDAPIAVQSMTNVNTNDISKGVEQTIKIVEAGGEMVRFTTQGVREAKSLGEVHQELRKKGYRVPLVADVHFNPRAAYEAAQHIEKVRINPGNFFDPPHKFQYIEYTDEEYATEVASLQDNFSAFLQHCAQHNTAIRIGVNHGSLSDRITSKYGDTPQGMVASCMEYLEVAQRMNFTDIVLSIKTSNTVLMVQTVRLLVEEMDRWGMSYPLHLGVTEAGEGEDGRIKSAVGIGALLSSGLGDTIRVSLSEAPEEEIPVARLLVHLTKSLETTEPIPLADEHLVDTPYRSGSLPIVLLDTELCPHSDLQPDGWVNTAQKWIRNNNTGEITPYILIADTEVIKNPRVVNEIELEKTLIISLTHTNIPAILRAIDHSVQRPYLLHLFYDAIPEEMPTRLGFLLGDALMRGQAEGIWLQSTSVAPTEINRLSFALLQAARRRTFQTEFISCPSCGRTLFDLPQTVAEVKRAVSHLKGLKIGIMGCIVNGPGEMADADYGYVGASPGKIDLYKSKTCVQKNIPQKEAVHKLIQLIKDNGDWIDP